MGQHSSPKLSVLYWSMDVYPGTLALAWYSWYNPQTSAGRPCFNTGARPLSTSSVEFTAVRSTGRVIHPVLFWTISILLCMILPLIGPG